jgi:hypothetical protein
MEGVAIAGIPVWILFKPDTFEKGKVGIQKVGTEWSDLISGFHPGKCEFSKIPVSGWIIEIWLPA